MKYTRVLMIRSPRRHEGPPKRPEQTTISTTGLAFGAARGGHAIRHNISLCKPRVNVNSQGSVFSRKTHDISDCWSIAASLESPRAPASSSGRNGETLFYCRIGGGNGVPK